MQIQPAVIPTAENLIEGTDAEAFSLPRRDVRMHAINVPFPSVTRLQQNDEKGRSFNKYQRTNGTRNVIHASRVFLMTGKGRPTTYNILTDVGSEGVLATRQLPLEERLLRISIIRR